MTKPKLHVVVCSTRPGRVGSSIAKWATGAAQAHGGFDPQLIELESFKLPVFNEPAHPAMGQYEYEHTKAWSASVRSADAFVFVLPEYNFAPPASLINAMNYLVKEWHYKPVAFVSYGGVSGGLRSVQVTKQLVTTLKMMPMLEAVAIHNVSTQLDANRQFAANEQQLAAANTMLSELQRWTAAMAQLRG